MEENQRAALAGIVLGISRLDAAGHWGDGTTSASDGQRFAMPHEVLQHTYSTRFNDFALEFYSHASIHNHFNRERHLYNRENFKLKRSAALAEWRQLAA